MKHKNLDLKNMDSQLMTTTEMKESNGGVIIWAVVGYVISGIAVGSALTPFIIKATRNVYNSIKDAITCATHEQQQSCAILPH